MVNQTFSYGSSGEVVPLKKTGKKPVIIAIGGGKGGIGKTVITVNLGVSLVWQKKKVVLIDADLGGANLHTCLGLGTMNAPTLSDFITDSVSEISDTLVPTELNGLQLISGARDSMNAANITGKQKIRFLNALNSLDVDYVFLDLGAGTTYNVIDFFLAASNGILIMLPEPTSVENVYRFIKVAFYRRLRSVENAMGIEELISKVMRERGDEEIKTPLQLLDAVKEEDRLRGEALHIEMRKFNPGVIVNMVRTSADVDMGSSVSYACKKYFGVNVDYLGHIHYSNCIWQSVRNRRPLIIDFPNSTLITNFSNIIRKLQENVNAKI